MFDKIRFGRQIAVFLIVFGLVAGLVSCKPACVGENRGSAFPMQKEAEMFPSYPCGIVLPPDMAPLDFRIVGDSVSDGPYCVFLYAQDKDGRLLDSMQVRSKRFVQFGLSAWKRCLRSAASNSGSLRLEIYGRTEGKKWVKYPDVVWKTVSDSIDPYLIYRLSAHDENPCLHLQVCQRTLGDFTQTVLMDNRLTGDNCMNCHANSGNDAAKMLVHIRGKNAGTLIFHGKDAIKIAIPEGYPDLRLAYPAWSPDGRYIAFATTRIHPYVYANAFRTQDLIADTLGSIVVYDVAENRLFSHPELMDARYESTFPAWSPDGKTLYFCRTRSLGTLRDRPGDVIGRKADLAAFRYNLVSVSFDPETQSFGRIETVYDFDREGLSASMPAVSPDGRYIVVSTLLMGSFPSQNQGDLALLDLHAKGISADMSRQSPVLSGGGAACRDVGILNSPDGEKYHAWSSNGRWLVFGSKRINGATAHVYIAYFNRDGTFSRPFVLPQESDNFYLKNTRTFLFPSLSRTPAAFTREEWARAVGQEPLYPDMRYFESWYKPGAPAAAAGH